MLTLCLLIVLCAVIGLSYYENREYFKNLLPTIGNTVKCAKNAPAGTTSDTLFQFARNNKLNKYTNLDAAKEWDPINANQPKIIDDCKAYTLGTEMKVPGPGTKYGMTVNCATNPPGDKPVDTYFQYSANQVLNWYPNKETADVYWGKRTTDISNNDPLSINDCSGFSLGRFLESKDSGIQITNPLVTKQLPTTSESNPKLSDIDIKNWTKQLGTLLSASNSAQSVQSLSAPAQPVRQEVKPQVSVSDTGYNAMQLQNQSSLLSNIKKIVQDELRTSRVQSKNHPLALSGKNNSSSNSTKQGKEYMNEKKDMSKYIKKDSIPCWGCTLDY